jgi:transketolase
MRRAFCETLLNLAEDPDFVFLTGDLGFAALEPLRDRLEDRFINAGVAEQNMVGVAAGLARSGFRPWIYSIAPFLYARAFEQIRNDLCFHGLPAVVVGNGGGYGYGVMGATHHALEDYGVLQTLAGMRICIPAFDRDLETLIPALGRSTVPAYLRLGLQTQPAGFEAPGYLAWRQLVVGNAGILIAVGPLAGMYWGAAQELPLEQRPSIWCLTELPIREVPDELILQLQRTRRLVVAEEHTATGSVGSHLAGWLLGRLKTSIDYTHITACGYPSGRYGSQSFHRRESGLDTSSIMSSFRMSPRNEH